MTHAELRGSVEQAVSSVPFTPPLTVAYTELVRDALRKAAPKATSVEAFFRVASKRSVAEFVAEARDGETIYTLTVPIP
jgi:hypothetical protein